jgi:hypothetical protein
MVAAAGEIVTSASSPRSVGVMPADSRRRAQAHRIGDGGTVRAHRDQYGSHRYCRKNHDPEQDAADRIPLQRRFVV